MPIDLLAYCGALRQLPANQIKGREFETLDKSPHTNPNDPPLFVTIFRNFEQENTLFCHSFIIRHDEEAMELVKLVMEIYYNLIRLQELDETSLQDQDENYSLKSGSSSKQSDSIRSKLEALNIQNSADKAKKGIFFQRILFVFGMYLNLIGTWKPRLKYHIIYPLLKRRFV